jgi:Flp pilus assembly protein TadG
MATRLRRDERGQSLVEFALVIPIVILLMIGLFDLGRIVFTNNSLSDGARHAARNAATDPRAADYCADVEQAMRSAIRGQELTVATVEYQVTNADDTDDGAPYLLCQLNGSGTLVNGPGKAALPSYLFTRPGHDRVTVSIEASLNLATPFVASATGSETFDLGAASTMVATFAP